MTRMRRTALALLALALSGAAAPASAQGRGADLATLSRIFGELHHIRRTCEPDRESDVWRDRMQQLVRLEEPSPDVRAQMIEAFNSGFRSAEQRFPYCDRDARNSAAASAAEAEDVTSRLMAPLYDSLADQGLAPPPATVQPIAPSEPAAPQQ